MKKLLFALAILASVPSCKKCYLCTAPGSYSCVGGTYAGTYSSTSYQTACVTGGGQWVTLLAAGQTKHCYNTSGPLGGALNGQASKESEDESNCVDNGGVWTSQ